MVVRVRELETRWTGEFAAHAGSGRGRIAAGFGAIRAGEQFSFACIVCVCGSPGWQCKLIARLPQFVAASVSLAFSTLRSQMTLTLTLIAAAGDATNATIEATSQQDRRKKDLPQQTLRYPAFPHHAPPLHSYQRGNETARGHLHVPIAICCCCS